VGRERVEEELRGERGGGESARGSCAGSGRRVKERTLVTPPRWVGMSKSMSGECADGSYRPTEPEKEPAARQLEPVEGSGPEKASDEMMPA